VCGELTGRGKVKETINLNSRGSGGEREKTKEDANRVIPHVNAERRAGKYKLETKYGLMPWRALLRRRT